APPPNHTLRPSQPLDLEASPLPIPPSSRTTVVPPPTKRTVYFYRRGRGTCRRKKPTNKKQIIKSAARRSQHNRRMYSSVEECIRRYSDFLAIDVGECTSQQLHQFRRKLAGEKFECIHGKNSIFRHIFLK